MSTFNEAEHPREPAGTSIGGRFTAAPGSGGAGRYGYSLSRAAKSERDSGARPGARAAFMELFERVAKPDGGFTYQPVSDKSPKEGFAVSPYPERSAAFGVKELRMSDVFRYYVKNRDMFRRPGHYFGAWHDRESGKVFLDVSVVKSTHGEARRMSIEKDQIAYYDLAAGSSVTVNRSAKSGGVV